MKASLNCGISHCVELSIVVSCLKEDHGDNLAQVEDNNANGTDTMAYMLWNIIAP